ncbi:leucine-rich repeat-containing protein 38 [Engraulis encrasicolus]|uniref:leucine-rich repeat-containing protein 38 n=1 Tax=Engraulis encrasicolus TaxID=184585 RepID=UPI002FCFFE18
MLPCARRLQPLLLALLSSFSTFFWAPWASCGNSCPPTCLCPDQHTVDCTGQGLTRLPDAIPLDVRRLLLSDNWIPWIPSDFLVLYSDLVYLDLRNNSLSRVEPGTLSTSSRLVFLDLGSNNLTEIPSGTFRDSRSLIKLRLGNNPYLSAVGADAFSGLTSLRELELERNALAGLDVGVLSQLPSLRVLRLEGNPWVCNCHFAKLFLWLSENRHKLPSGLDGMECSLPVDGRPVDGRQVPLSMLSEDSFRECRGILTLTDYLVVIFSGICVSVAAIMASFFLACTVSVIQRWGRFTKSGKDEMEE